MSCISIIIVISLLFDHLTHAFAFVQVVPLAQSTGARDCKHVLKLASVKSIESASEASQILSDWDKSTNPDSKSPKADNLHELRQQVPLAVRYLNDVAAEERSKDHTKGKK
jgi:hypothetical protein